MSDTDFFDTNILLYLISGDLEKANQSELLLAKGGVISVQVLNEFTTVAIRKAGMSLAETREFLETVRLCCRVEAITEETHDLAVKIATRYQYQIYDASILASAELAQCRRIFSEDMQHRQQINDALLIYNPYIQPSQLE